MRSGLLLIGSCLTPEVPLPGTTNPGKAEEPLDAYVRSISQLAQPCSAGSEPPRPCRAPRARARGTPSRSSDKGQPSATSLQDITAQFNGQQSSPGLRGAADPLAWLYGLSDPKQQMRSPASCPSQPAPESDLQAAPGPFGIAPKPGAPFVPGQSSCRWQRSRRRAALPGSAIKGRPGRPQNSRLPVIYEL
ncbi:protein DEPP1 [Dromaius novaehollandiae]|uniref:protein DEPP1 n=1 Tax=Dromaius novaehollandiae TaxID=8790 RepID=UPI00311D64E1